MGDKAGCNQSLLKAHKVCGIFITLETSLRMMKYILWNSKLNSPGIHTKPGQARQCDNELLVKELEM